MKLYDKLHNVVYSIGTILNFQDFFYIIDSINKEFITVTLHKLYDENGPPKILTLKEFEQGLEDIDGLRHIIEIKED